MILMNLNLNYEKYKNRMVIEPNRTEKSIESIEFLHLFGVRLVFDWVRKSNDDRSIAFD